MRKNDSCKNVTDLIKLANRWQLDAYRTEDSLKDLTETMDWAWGMQVEGDAANFPDALQELMLRFVGQRFA